MSAESVRSAPSEQRRRTLAAIATASLAGSLLLSGCSDAGEAVAANEDLMREHGVLRRILIVYREMAPRILASPQSIDVGALSDAGRLFRRFGEHYHERLLEESHIFPIARNSGAEAAKLVDILLAQHARGREITDFLLGRTAGARIAAGDAAAVAAAMTSFARMYEAHAAREDTVIFPAFKAALGAKSYQDFGEQFEDIEHREFGGDGFDLAVAKVAKIEQRLGLADLASFTAPAIMVAGQASG